MAPAEQIEERLRRIAESLRFRHYIVCAFCAHPLILLEEELDAAPDHLVCEECGSVVAYEARRVCTFDPPARAEV